MMIAKTGIALLWVSVLLVLGTSSAFAQSPTTGRIAGTVKDERGALLVGADVTVSSKTTAGERRVATDNQANYAVPLLPPGAYRVTITANGFATSVFDPVQVVITETTTVDANLPVAGPDVATVSIDPLVQKDGPQLGRVVDSRAVSELPLATRNFTHGWLDSPASRGRIPASCPAA